MVWLKPDDVIPGALRVLAAHKDIRAHMRLITDTKGRLRLAINHPERDQRSSERASREKVKEVQDHLARVVDAWFVPPVIDGNGSPAFRRIAADLFKRDEPWPGSWPTEWELQDGSMEPVASNVSGRVVMLSKESWLGPGPSVSFMRPRVVAFYSFKGGVGRTTTLACVARHLATAKQLKVVAVDLDLEAPGLGSFLGSRSDTGVLDHVLSHVATGAVGQVEPERVDGVEGLWVMPAGSLGPGYVEKLARLDFLSGAAVGDVSPAQAALAALLDEIRQKLNPDAILLDSRAGLHDLGGLALHRLSHTDVLVARANAQAREGMRMVLSAIQRMRPELETRSVRIVQTMVPIGEEARPIVERWRQHMWEDCLGTIYADMDDNVPELTDESGAHSPLLVEYRDEFTRYERVQEVPQELLPFFDRIADLVVDAPEEEET